ncbi:DUF4118 domain-containing protein [Saccharothrix texasensis]|uniref:DUF4118 domain-containing protein n=1 Tax=Saccharothrix texasensis TaxID=103734 RepID=UPI00268B9C7C
MVAPAVVTGLGVLGRDEMSFSTDLVGFFLATVVVALVGGLGPALGAALLGAGLLNFFFTAPSYSLAVATLENLVTLLAMLTVAFLVALVVDRAARLAEQGARARTVLTSPHPLPRLLGKVRENFGLESVALLERHDGEWERVACVGPGPCGEPDEADVDVPVTADVHLALRGRTLPASDQRALEAAADQALLALLHQRMTAEPAEARRRAETTELRTAILSAVGHDLRNPADLDQSRHRQPARHRPAALARGHH